MWNVNGLEIEWKENGLKVKIASHCCSKWTQTSPCKFEICSQKDSYSVSCPPYAIWKRPNFWTYLLHASWHLLPNSRKVKVFEGWVKYWSSIYGKCSAWKDFVSCCIELHLSKKFLLHQILCQSLSPTVDLFPLYIFWGQLDISAVYSVVSVFCN